MCIAYRHCSNFPPQVLHAETLGIKPLAPTDPGLQAGAQHDSLPETKHCQGQTKVGKGCGMQPRAQLHALIPLGNLLSRNTHPTALEINDAGSFTFNYTSVRTGRDQKSLGCVGKG